MKFLLKILPFCILIAPVLAFAQYQPLVGIPGVGTNASNFDQYLQAVYATSISLAALLAVIKIVIAGVKWMTTDIVEGKSSAKKDIQGAILGLIVILSAVLILYIINPNIGAVSLNLVNPPTPSPAVTTSTTGSGAVSQIERYCDIAGNECLVRSCDALGEYSWELAAVSATGGAIAGSIAGSAIPVIGNLGGGTVGTLAGFFGGAVAAYKTQLALNNGECSLVCNWYEGKMTAGGCLMATNAAAFKETQLAEIRKEIADVKGCSSGDGYYIGGTYRCTENYSETERTEVINSLGVTVNDELQETIIQRLQDSLLTESVITDSAIRTGFGSAIGGETVLLVEVPTRTLESGGTAQYSEVSAEYTDVQRVVEGICNDARRDTGNSEIGLVSEEYAGKKYISCARP